MFLYNARIGRLKLTELARNRFLARMLSQMNHVRHLSGRFMTANVADERFDLTVNGFDVFRQHLRIGEHVVANFAFLFHIPAHLGTAFVLMMRYAMHAKLRELFENFRAI